MKYEEKHDIILKNVAKAFDIIFIADTVFAAQTLSIEIYVLYCDRRKERLQDKSPHRYGAGSLGR